MRQCALMALLVIMLLPGWAEPLAPDAARAATDAAITELVDLERTLGDQYFHTGQWDNTIAVLQHATDLDPTDVETFGVIAWLQWSMKDREQALRTFERLLARNPDNPLAWFEVGGHFFLKERNYPESLPYLERADALANPPLPLPDRHLLGHNYEKLGRTAEAIAFWQRMLALDATDEVARKRLDALRGEKTE